MNICPHSMSIDVFSPSQSDGRPSNMTFVEKASEGSSENLSDLHHRSLGTR